MLKVEYRNIDTLIPYARNAKKHSPESIATLAGMITEFGWTNPILADKDGIIAGHGRVSAARMLYEQNKTIRLPSGESIPEGKVPVIDVTGWTEAQRRAAILADNRSGEIGGGWDVELLNLEIEELKLEDFPLDLTGFDDASLEEKYCDVILQRWSDFTGKDPILESTGQTFSELSNGG